MPHLPHAALGAPLFSFVVVADTHINEQDGASASPYLTNRLANDRARHVFQEIAAMDPPPRFVVHLGDIVNPVPSLPTFHEAVARYREIAQPVTLPVHLVPGNHDVGDKCVEWMPAGQVCDAYLETYRAAFGEDFYAFDEEGLRCIIVNSLLLNSGLPDEARQRAWLEEQVATAGQRRVFLFMHYPPYIFAADERANYDNVDEPARSWLLDLIRRPGVEAVFAGHVHNFWYDRIGAAEFYMLPSTAFLRHDFTEFYRVAPATEFGRGDADKFGYFIVDVYTRGHVAHPVRTMGRYSEAGAPAAPRRTLHLTHPKTATFDDVGVELRHPWTERMQITATGGVQEFGRKWARNDYPLLALWEMGARLSKVTDMDLHDPEARARMAQMARFGHRYIVTTLGVPKAASVEAQPAQCGVAAFEVNLTGASFQRQQEALRAARQATGAAIYYARIAAFDDSHYDGKHFSHFVKSGFTLDELPGQREALVVARAAGVIDGVTVRIEPEQPLCQAARVLAEFAEGTGCQVLASLKTSGPNLATERAEDDVLAARAAQAMILSKALRGVRFVFDTFMDVDRGYYPRHGLIDRRFNPRPAATVFRMLNAVLADTTAFRLVTQDNDDTGMLRFEADGASYCLLCLDARAMAAQLALLPVETTVHGLADGVTRTATDWLNFLRELPAGEAGTLQVLLATA
ncbi:MAG TPA: metallophosphoesterase [Burkholderiaceae bacterium]|nr:metallophosphoesterase [Burkholderiaceae bacterium]